MKVVTILSLLLLTTSAFAQLTKEDVRTIVKEESAASEKRMREYIDLKVEAINARFDATNGRIDALEKNLNARIGDLNARIGDIDKKFDRVWYMIIALIGLITAAIAIPQIVIAHRESGKKEMQAQIDQLREKIEAMNP